MTGYSRLPPLSLLSDIASQNSTVHVAREVPQTVHGIRESWDDEWRRGGSNHFWVEPKSDQHRTRPDFLGLQGSIGLKGSIFLKKNLQIPEYHEIDKIRPG